MNYSYKKIYQKDIQSHNSYLIFSGNIEDKNVQVHAYVGVPLNQINRKRIINMMFYFERVDENFIDNYLHEITDDISEIIKKEYSNQEMFEIAFCSYFIVDKISNVIPATFGDYNIG